MSKKLPPDPRDYYVHNDVSLEELAELYAGKRGCSLGNLKLRSSKEKWVRQLDHLSAETRLKMDSLIVQSKAQGLASIQSKLEQLRDVTLDVHLEFMTNLKDQVKDIQNPYLFDGERTNSLFQTAMNNAVKVLLAAMKEQDSGPEEEPAGFIVSQDSDASDQAPS